jgi:cytochrome c oxidase subunit IV
MAKKHASWVRYVVVWVALLALTLSSFLLSLAHLGGLDIVLALLIAVIKSVLVGLFFMDLLDQRFTNWMVPAVAVSLVALLALLLSTDVATRQTFPRAPLPFAGPPGVEKPRTGVSADADR